MADFSLSSFICGEMKSFWMSGRGENVGTEFPNVEYKEGAHLSMGEGCVCVHAHNKG